LFVDLLFNIERDEEFEACPSARQTDEPLRDECRKMRTGQERECAICWRASFKGDPKTKSGRRFGVLTVSM
jgi:hypothetical protein